MFSRYTGSLQCLVNVNYRILICCTCHFHSGSLLFISASSVCKSLRCLIPTLTRGGKGGHLLDSLVQLCCGEGATLQTNITGVCGVCSQCMDHTGFAPAQGECVSWVSTAQAPGCSAGELSKVSPVFHPLPRSNSLRFSGTPQGYRLGWACVLCPSQVQAVQTTSCLVSALSQVGKAS